MEKEKRGILVARVIVRIERVNGTARVLLGDSSDGDSCSPLTLSGATDRSGRGIADSKSRRQPGTCILEFTIVGQSNGASPRRRECQSQANKTGRKEHVGVYNGWP